MQRPMVGPPRGRARNTFPIRGLWILLAISMGCGFIVIMLFGPVKSRPNEDLEHARNRIADLETAVKHELEPLRQLASKQEKELEACLKRTPSTTLLPHDTNKKLMIVEKRFERMKRVAQALALERLRRKFPGNTRETVTFMINTSKGTLVAETFPFATSPVTIEYFLDLVEKEFWTDTCFFRVEHHVVQATAESATSTKRKTGHGVLFQETNRNEHAHDKFTLGLAGRPGGPDFYVNMLENHRTHGPGGQGEEFPGDVEADPCFAILRSGQEVITAIQALPYKKENGLHILQDRVTITSIIVQHHD